MEIINFDNEPQEKLSEEWWNWYFELGCCCIIENTRTKKVYKGQIYCIRIDFFEEKTYIIEATFYLDYDLNTKERKNRHIKINPNNKGYHKVINFFY